MNKNKRKILIVAFCIILILASSTIFIGMAKDSAHAESQETLTPEQYTDSDYLINPDGTLDKSKTIKDFAKEVQELKANKLVQDIDRVFPLHYLNEEDDYATYSYMGKEYGFYMYRQDRWLVTLLIDFVHVCNDGENQSDREHKIRIEPILQETFLRYSSEGFDYVWTTTKSDTMALYVANPRFSSALYNENALNYGDEGYSKQSDAGLIINQCRYNYSEVIFTSGNYFEKVAKFTAKKVIDFSMDLLLDYIYYPASEIPKMIFHAIESSEDLISEMLEIKTEETVYANNENNIETNMSRFAQLNDDRLDTFTRSAAVMSKDSIVISDGENSYAEFITVVNDSGYRSRLVEVCEFDILLRSDWAFGRDLIYLTSPEDNTSFRYCQDEVLYENQGTNFEIKNENIGGAVPVYLLPNGKQTISFTPKYSGLYSFQYPPTTRLSLNGVIDYLFYLTAGETYNFKLESKSKTNKIIGTLSCEIKQFSANEAHSIAPKSNHIIKYQSDNSEYKKLQASNTNVKIGLLDESLNVIESADYNCAFANFVKGKTYYILFANDTSQSQSTQVVFGSPNEMSTGTEYKISSLEKVMMLKNNSSSKEWYKLQFNDLGNNKAIITNDNGNVISSERKTQGNTVYYTFALNPYEHCYINFDRANGSITASVNVSETRFKWLIDGVEIDGFNIRLKPNTDYRISGEISVDGGEYQAISAIATDIVDTRISFLNGVLRIGNGVKNFTQIKLTPDNAASFSLTITVDDMCRTITLESNDGIGKSQQIKVEIGKEIDTSQISEPTRKGYTFLGYFTQSNSGTCYITADMKGQVWHGESDATLYAHWEQNKYILLFDNGNNQLNYTMTYGSRMPTDRPYAPKWEGYCFLGYYTQRDGKGDNYYKATGLVDDRQSAEIYGYTHYYVEGMQYCWGSDIWDRESDLTLYAHWKKMTCEYACPHVIDGESYSGNYTHLSLKHEVEVTVTAKSSNGEGDFMYFKINGKTIESSSYNWTPHLRRNPIDGSIVPTEDLLIVFAKKECVAEGTLITLADGRQVPVETLTGKESLLVWNLLTGKFDVASILFIDKEAAREYNVINLYFSDGTNVKVISEHGFWDFNLNKYVYLDKDAAQFIGHWFNKQVTDDNGQLAWTKVQLVDVVIAREYTTVYSPVTYGHLCYYVNGMLSMPGGIGGLFNIFDVNTETMKYDEVAMQADIEQYGLFTYEEFAEILPLPIEMFEAVNGQYLKVAIGKGLIDVETLEGLIARYAEYFVNM